MKTNQANTISASSLAIAKKLILIAAANTIVGCAVDAKNFDQLTDRDKAELSHLLNTPSTPRLVMLSVE